MVQGTRASSRFPGKLNSFKQSLQALPTDQCIMCSAYSDQGCEPLALVPVAMSLWCQASRYALFSPFTLEFWARFCGQWEQTCSLTGCGRLARGSTSRGIFSVLCLWCSSCQPLTWILAAQNVERQIKSPSHIRSGCWLEPSLSTFTLTLALRLTPPLPLTLSENLNGANLHVTGCRALLEAPHEPRSYVCFACGA